MEQEFNLRNMNLKIFTEPKVYLVGQQIINDDMIDQFLADEGVQAWSTDAISAGEKLSEIAGRTCYMSFAKPRPGGNKAYMSNILESGHGSVLEHACFNFIVTQVSRSFSHELVRHRAGWGYSQLSQRYVNESDCNFVCPEIINKNDNIKKLWIRSIENSLHDYEHLISLLGDLPEVAAITDKTLRLKTARQSARSVLPNATETKIFFTANARALRHFLELRGSIHAEPEIRRMAVLMLDLLKVAAPTIFMDFYVDENGIIHNSFRKV